MIIDVFYSSFAMLTTGGWYQYISTMGEHGGGWYQYNGFADGRRTKQSWSRSRLETRQQTVSGNLAYLWPQYDSRERKGSARAEGLSLPLFDVRWCRRSPWWALPEDIGTTFVRGAARGWYIYLMFGKRIGPGGWYLTYPGDKPAFKPYFCFFYHRGC